MSKIIDRYDAFAHEYAEAVEHKKIHTDYERPNTWSLLPPSLTGLAVLDAGCGSGWYTEQLVQAGANVTAVDLSPNLIKLTQQRVGDQAECICLPLESLAKHFKPASFDIILAPLVVHYIQDWEKLFQDFALLLKPNGLLIFSTHQPQTVYHLFNLKSYFDEQFLEDQWQSPPMTVQYYHHTLHSLSEALYHAGFVIERMLEPFPPETLKSEGDIFQKMQTQPWFLFVRAKKATS